MNDSENTPAQNPAARRAAAAADARRDTRQRNTLIGLNEPAKPVKNAGLIGKELQEKIAKYRKRLQKEAKKRINTGGEHSVRLKTIKEAVIDAIRAFQKSGRIKKLPDKIEGLEIGELYPYLPRFDWREYRVVPPVRHQLNNPLCWAFTATAVFESSLMIQRANYATNDLPRIPNVFLIDMVQLNARSTWECMGMKETDSGRHEAAFNFYCDEGIRASEIELFLGVPVTDAPGTNLHIEDRISLEQASKVLDNPVALDKVNEPPTPHTPAAIGGLHSFGGLNEPPASHSGGANRDAPMPEGHCKDRTNRIKAKGWDYVREKNQWKIPYRDDMKRALLEYGPLAVAMKSDEPNNDLTAYGHQKIDANCSEVGRNQKTGVVFKEDLLSKDLFVRFPRKAFGIGLKYARFIAEGDDVKLLGPTAYVNLCPTTYVNLNLTRDELNDWMIGQRTNPYRILGAAARCIRQGSHLRAAKEDRDVGTFYDRETDEFIWHFPASNAIRLETEAETGAMYLSFPANTEATFGEDSEGNLGISFPAGKKFEDLAPVFRANPKADTTHYVLLIGWDDQKRAWIIQNSWGEDWGYRCHPERGGSGYGYIAYGTFGQFAAWLGAPLLDQNLWRDKNGSR